MRNLLLVCAGLVVVLGITSGNLWRELRKARQEIAAMQPQMPPAQAADSGSTQALQSTLAAPTTAVVQAQVPDPRPAPAQLPPVPLPGSQMPAAVIEEALRSAAMLDSDQTATARVRAWGERMLTGGQPLTTAQLQALSAAAITELRRETDESLKASSTVGPMNAETAARMRDETIDRQNDTNLRILKAVTPQLDADQIKALRTMFEAGDAARRAAAKVERERALNPGN